MAAALASVAEFVRGMPKCDGEIVIPPKQLLMQLIDLVGFYEASNDWGFFDFIKKYYFKKYSHSYEKFLSSFLKSLLRFGKEGSEVGFFAKLIELNYSHSIMTPVSEAVKFLRKKFTDLMSRNDDTFRRVRVNFNDVVNSLKKIFGMYNPN